MNVKCGAGYPKVRETGNMKKTTTKVYAVQVVNGLQAEPKTQQELMAARQGQVSYINGFVGQNRDKADVFTLLEPTLESAKLFATLAEAKAFAQYLVAVKNDARLAGRVINVITIEVHDVPAKVYNNVLRADILKAEEDRQAKAKVAAEAAKEAEKKKES